MRLDTLLLSAVRILKKARISTADLDAEILLSAALKRDRSFLFAHPEYIASHKEVTVFAKHIAYRSRRIPVAYILGYKEFYRLSFHVSQAVLIPRPETELLVDEALRIIAENPDIRHIVDIGTGSGCIPIAIAKNAGRPIDIRAYDTSQIALSIARKNAKRNSVSVRFTVGDLLVRHTGTIDLLCANLPYLSQTEYRAAVKKYPELKTEPKSALVAREHGHALNTTLLKQAARKMDHGFILLEIGASQGNEMKKRAQTLFLKSKIEIVKDLAGRSRVLKIQVS